MMRAGCIVPFVVAAVLAGPCLAEPALPAPAVRVKDLGRLQGWRENALFGYGLVTGLAGSGDAPSNRTTRLALSNVLAQFNLTVAPEQVSSRNVAVVVVSATLPAFAREGDTLDVTVNSAGDARSLVGGTLLITPLKGPDGRIHALAQGPLSVGGYRYDSQGNVIQKNHPTVGAIPGGAVVELAVPPGGPHQGPAHTFLLSEPDYTTASRVADAINAQLGAAVARAADAQAIEIAVPPGLREDLVAYLARIESVLVVPDRRARVVINERTGTVVAGGDVAIGHVAISHGDLKISISSETAGHWHGPADRLPGRGRGGLPVAARVEVQEHSGGVFVQPATTVADLVQSLARLRTQTRDIISILRAVKAAGALHADLVVQ